MIILGSCLALNLSTSGCCVWSLSQNCSNNRCFCDQICHFLNDCRNDITDINCHPASLSSPNGSDLLTHILWHSIQLFTNSSRSFDIPGHHADCLAHYRYL